MLVYELRGIYMIDTYNFTKEYYKVKKCTPYVIFARQYFIVAQACHFTKISFLVNYEVSLKIL